MQQPALYGNDTFSKYYESGLWGSRLLVDFFDERALLTPDKVAIVEAHRSHTYVQVKAATQNLAAALLDLGVCKGDVVAVQSPNWTELPMLHLATDRIGAIFLPLSEGFREKELLHLLNKAQAKVLFCPAKSKGQNHIAFMQSLQKNIGLLRHIPMRGTMEGEGAGRLANFESMVASTAWRQTLGEEGLARMRSTSDAPSHVMVSSGSTGMPRCSLFSDNNTLVKLVQQYVQASDVTSSDVAAALAPAGTGATGYNYPILAMLLHGGTSVLLEHWSSSNVQAALDLMENTACTMAVAVPAQLVMLVNAAEQSKRKLPTLRVITNSGAKLLPQVAEAAERLFSCKVQVIYGTSEAGATAMTSIHDSDEKRRNTVGRPLVGQQVKLIDDDGVEVPVGNTGEVCWRGANKSFGFLHDFESTHKVWDAEGWMHSGDLGMFDPDGYLCIVGRKKDMIIRGGQNINPGAIEEALLKHPSIHEVAVVGFEDAVLGERIAACVVSGDSAIHLDMLKAMVLAQGLAAWHQPEMLMVLDELPRNVGGKIDKRALATLAAARANAAFKGTKAVA
jgi:non-ribosomal peptide synthetase component E (peptide arylation enzyme)